VAPRRRGILVGRWQMNWTSSSCSKLRPTCCSCCYRTHRASRWSRPLFHYEAGGRRHGPWPFDYLFDHEEARGLARAIAATGRRNDRDDSTGARVSGLALRIGHIFLACCWGIGPTNSFACRHDRLEKPLRTDVRTSVVPFRARRRWQARAFLVAAPRCWSRCREASSLCGSMSQVGLNFLD
jgi:hypothetical protein